MPETDVGALIIALLALVMAIGLLGTLLPLVPGLPLIWASALGYGLFEGFGGSGIAAMLAISAVGTAGLVAGIILPARRMAGMDAPRSTLVAGAAGGLVGFFLIPLVGLVIGAILGVLIAEYNRSNEWTAAWVTTRAVVVGFGLGVAAQLLAGIVMIAIWVAWVLIS
jgi:uncharacterized protein YqgC (DUF456 family)